MMASTVSGRRAISQDGQPRMGFTGSDQVELVDPRDLGATDVSKPEVLIIVTGGTLCMTPEGVGSSLRPASVSSILREILSHEDPAIPHCDILEWDDLIDSSDVTYSHWLHICSDIENNYGKYDGFLVLHGTDTLAYTASGLSFMLENLNKPVVLTGAMLPIRHLQTDARKNFTLSVMVAAYSQLTEVVIVFGTKLLRGNRTTKLNCSRMDAFQSLNFPPLGELGVDICLDEKITLAQSKRTFRVFRNMCMNIVIITMTPGFNSGLLRHIFSWKTRPLAVILRLYGSGTAPTHPAELLECLQEGLQSGVVIVSVSQCAGGTCSLMLYENGARFAHIGVIEAKDMTLEAAFAKLAYLMGKGYNGDKLRYFMETDLRGEVTENFTKVSGQTSLVNAAHQRGIAKTDNLIPYHTDMNGEPNLEPASAYPPSSVVTDESPRVFCERCALDRKNRSNYDNSNDYDAQAPDSSPTSQLSSHPIASEVSHIEKHHGPQQSLRHGRLLNV